MAKHDHELTMDSRIRDVWNTPVGHDILAKIMLQLGMDEGWITNPVTASMKLKMLARPASRFLDDDFWPAFLHLINSEKDRPGDGKGPVKPQWWKEAVFYQIYPRTFAAGSGSGQGDLKGILSKLDYLKDLGVDALWLSPVYDSPMDDNGYDIRDYRKIHPDFGTMEDFDLLLQEVHARGMRLIMDLVVNHTSDEHAFFQEALKDENSPYRDFYFIRRDEGHVPNNWTSFFSGSAWDRYGERGEWALHLFSKKQMDLNWDNPAVRRAVSDLVCWWLEKGVDGFRLDVINYISKAPGLPQGNESVGRMMGYTGIEHYFYGPNLHAYLHELHENSFARYHAFSVGETPGLGMEMAKLVTAEGRGELDMIFSFDHLENPGHVRFEEYRYDLNALRDYLIDWTENYGNDCWMSLFWNNHDNPRMISKIDPEGVFRRPLAILLAVLQMTLRGTPFIYQGDEMGLGNLDFHGMEELNDVESAGMYTSLLAQGKTPAEAFAVVKAGTRDHARQMLPWQKDPSRPAHLVQEADPAVTEAYRFLIRLRKENRALVYGDFRVMDRHHDRFVYTRSLDRETFLIDCNLSGTARSARHMDYGWTLVYPQQLQDTELPPYGVRIWKKRDTRR